MKLIECHISGFGSFKDYKLSFDDGLNVILQPNGWGKTTLAAYIKAMLYGFDRKRVRDVNENERLRYKPWNGGKYGGTLDFEFNGNEYRVLREFGATGSGDTLKVMDLGTGKPVRFKGEEVGDWIFGLDANAFQKSVFVGQNGFGFDGSTTGLRNRLNALVNEADDVAGLDKAQSSLDARRKFYKKTGNRGYIADVSSDMGKLLDRQKEYDFQIIQMGSLQERMSQLDSDIAQISTRIDEAQKKIDEAQAGEKDTAALKAAHDQLLERQKQATEAYRAYVEQVGEVPSESDLETVRKALDAVGRCKRDVAESNAAVEVARDKKAGIADKYSGAIPAKADIDFRKQQVAELAHQMEVIGLAKPNESNKYRALDDAIAEDAGLLSRADSVVSEWPGIERDLKSAAQLESLQSQVASLQEDIGSLADTTKINESTLEGIDRGVAACRDAASKLAQAKKAFGDEESKSANLKDARDKAADAVQQAQAAVADAEVAKAKATSEEASARAAKEEAAQTKGFTPVPAIACVAIGVVAAVAGFLMGPMSAVSIAAYIVAVVLVVAGIVLFTRKPTGDSDAFSQADASAKAAHDALETAKDAVDRAARAKDEASAKFDEAKAGYENQSAKVMAAKESVDQAAEADTAAKAELVDLLKAAMPAEDFDPETVAVQAPAIKERLATNGKKVQRFNELKSRVVDLEQSQDRVKQYSENLRPLLNAFNISADDDIVVEVERLKAAISGYRSYIEDTKKSAAETEQVRRTAEGLAADLVSWAKSIGLSGKDELSDEVFAAMGEDAATGEKIEWDIQQSMKKSETASANLEKLQAGIKQFMLQHGVADTEDASTAIEEVSKRAKRCDELANEAAVADDQLAAWEEKNAERLTLTKQGADNAQTAQLKAILTSLQSDRESLVAERAQAEEKRNAILKALESYLACAQEVRLLAQRKQEATAKLFTVQKTSEFLSKARANLDGRYLGGLTDRFNDYANTWLESEELDVVVGGDFDVAVSEGSSPHNVASYSTGYQDLLDICLRMALVDTVFEGEDPFIVMDDPFVNLDQDKISRAMLLLSLLSQKKQIIYFTCHPSRMEGESDAPKAVFTLPEQRASREMPKARAKREAEERARAQAELVASYHVEPVTQGRSAIEIADRSRVITNNMFNVRFAVDPDSGRRDNSFEVHFIDKQGRALCERQNIEVIDGRVVPERVRFCLTTCDDSGDAYDLIIHEQDKPEAELAARVHYKADISFNTEDFGF